MLHWAIILFVVGVVAAFFGFGGVAGAAFGAAKGLVFLKILGVVLVLAGVGLALSHSRPTRHLP